jgi:uncharacterized protein
LTRAARVVAYSEGLIAMEPPALPECLRCGACCFSALAEFVVVKGDDYERLGEQAERFVAFDGHRAHMRMEAGHCSALSLDVATGRFVCQVYEVRPSVCRDLGRGTGACGAERAAKAERALSALGRARAEAASPSAQLTEPTSSART